MALNQGDSFDMNDFVNFDQDFHSPDSTHSPESSKFEPRPTSDPRGRSQLSENRHYAGPSHDYGQYRQQTGLPTGAVQHLGNVDDFSRTSDFNNQIRPTAFGAAQFGNGYNSGINLDDFDMGSSSGMPACFLAGDSNGDDYIDPASVDTAPQPATAARAWPGMHSHQAQQAKAEAVAKQQRQRQQQQQQLSMQRQLPTNFEQTVKEVPPPNRTKTGSDPQMNDQISRLLTQMRHGSNASADDDETQAYLNDTAQSSRIRRDEDEMDEDERLLASEEGKKLTSKERRQLRNKVSARAFRSRRKEYISQLEGEVAAKTSEASDLMRQNRQLMEQNDQLTKLTRTLLSHSSFQTFMAECSNDPSILGGAQNTSAPSSSPQRSSATNTPTPAPVKQEPAFQKRENTHVGFTSIPENNLNFSMLNLGTNHWDSTASSFNFQQPQVFSVFEVPQPSLDEIRTGLLSGKPEEPSPDEISVSEVRKDLPELPSLPSDIAVHVKSSVAPVRGSRLWDDLNHYSENPAPCIRESTPKDSVPEAARGLGTSLWDNTNEPFNPTSVSYSEAVAVKHIDHMFASLEPVRRRIASISSILPE